MFNCPVGVWVIEQHTIILSATARSPTVKYTKLYADYTEKWRSLHVRSM